MIQVLAYIAQAIAHPRRPLTVPLTIITLHPQGDGTYVRTTRTI